MGEACVTSRESERHRFPISRGSALSPFHWVASSTGWLRGRDEEYTAAVNSFEQVAIDLSKVALTSFNRHFNHPGNEINTSETHVVLLCSVRVFENF
jgi:hypothetical protein